MIGKEERGGDECRRGKKREEYEKGEMRGEEMTEKR
jgi:hypothetical protein